MAISIQKVLDRFHFPPHSLRTDLFGLGEGCHPLRTGPLSVRTQLQALVLQPERGSFCRHTAAMLADFSQQAYRDRPIDSEFPLGSLRRPLVTPTTCGTFVRTHPDILSVDDVQLLVCRNDYGEIVFAFRGTEPAEELTGDWLRNFKTRLVSYDRANDLGGDGSKLHRGFFKGYRGLERKVEHWLEQLVTPSSRVYFTGHSQGGGLAIIAALDTAVKIAHGKLPQVPIAVYTFGNPRCMNRTCAKGLYRRLVPESFSVLIERDPVGKMPPLVRRPIKGPRGYSHIHNVVLMNDEVLPPDQDVNIDFQEGWDYRPEAVGLKGALDDKASHSLGRYRRLLRRDQALRSR